jgi:hypothetical protein
VRGARRRAAGAADAWESWSREIANARAWLEAADDLGDTFDHHGDQVEIRDIVVHMIEEYSRHCGHADRRTGQ